LSQPYLILLEDPANKFIQTLPPKQYKQIAARVFLLSRPADGRSLERNPALRRIDQGEYRILYTITDTARVITIRRIGTRNDAEVYCGL
jgi:mRNA interferase RelE/StbE